MSFEIKYLKDGLYMKFTGVYTTEVRNESIVECLNNPGKTEVKYVINDFTDVDQIKVTDQDIFSFASDDYFISLNLPDLKIAFVIRKDFELSFDTLMNKLPVLNSSWEYKIFYTIEEAKNWCEK